MGSGALATTFFLPLLPLLNFEVLPKLILDLILSIPKALPDSLLDLLMGHHIDVTLHEILGVFYEVNHLRHHETGDLVPVETVSVEEAHYF